MSYTKQQVDENTDYKASHAILLEDKMISVKQILLIVFFQLKLMVNGMNMLVFVLRLMKLINVNHMQLMVTIY